MSGTLAWSTLATAAPFLSAVPVAFQTSILGYVNNEGLDENVWGGPDSNKLALGRMYLAMHMGTLFIRGVLAGPTGAVGTVQVSTASKLSRTFATLAAQNTPNGSTIWGNLYDSLLRTCPLARLPVPGT